MNKWLIPAISSLALLNGCASVQRGSIPVVDSSTNVSNNHRILSNDGLLQTLVQRSEPSETQDSGVVVMVPGGGVAWVPGSSRPWTPWINTSSQINQGADTLLPKTRGIQSLDSVRLSAEEHLDVPVLALLTTAQQQQSIGDLNGASSSLERAQRVAPREPQVLYRLAQVRMAQSDAQQAEQFSRRGLTLATGRPYLQASLWALIGDARAAQGDAAGAAQARQKSQAIL